MTTKTEEMEACPFCGEALQVVASLARSFDPPVLYAEYTHRNRDCVMGHKSWSFPESAEEARQTFIAAWNRRPEGLVEGEYAERINEIANEIGKRWDNGEIQIRETIFEAIRRGSALGRAVQSLATLSHSHDSRLADEPWGYGWYELGGKKMASGYLPTIEYPRSENVSEGPFPLFRSTPAPDALREALRIARLVQGGIEDAQDRRTASESCTALIDHLEAALRTEGGWTNGR